MSAAPTSTIAALRERISALEAGTERAARVLPFGVPSLDGRLPQGGLALGCLHEVAGGGNGAVDGAAASSFAAGIAARLTGPVLWCVTQADLFAAGLEQAGLPPDRVIYVEAGDDRSVLASMEEGLRHGGLAAVVADVSRLPMTASRRLHLAARGSGTMGIALRRWRRQADASDFGQPTAAMTRWRISVLPSAPLPVPGVGRPRWLVELIRARAGESLDIELEACDGTGHLGLPADMADRSAAAAGGSDTRSVDVPLILAGRDGSRRIVTAADACARSLGLHPGMAVSKAQALVPGLQIEPADPREDLASLERLALWLLQRVSPIVAIDPPDGIVIDSTGADHLQGGEVGILEALIGRLTLSGVAARAAIADSWGAAHALARHIAAPSFIAEPGASEALLAPLPLEALRITPNVAAGLRDLGFERIGDLIGQARW